MIGALMMPVSCLRGNSMVEAVNDAYLVPKRGNNNNMVSALM